MTNRTPDGPLTRDQMAEAMTRLGIADARAEDTGSTMPAGRLADGGWIVVGPEDDSIPGPGEPMAGPLHIQTYASELDDPREIFSNLNLAAALAVIEGLAAAYRIAARQELPGPEGEDMTDEERARADQDLSGYRMGLDHGLRNDSLNWSGRSAAWKGGYRRGRAFGADLRRARDPEDGMTLSEVQQARYEAHPFGTVGVFGRPLTREQVSEWRARHSPGSR